MATQPAASRLFVLLFVLLFLIFIQFGSADQTIRAEPGQTVILPCEAARNKDEIIIDWSKPDLGENDHVALYRDDRFDYEGQNPSYKDRVDLLIIEIKNRKVSLVLKNVTINDAGTYECRVFPRGSDRRKRSYLKNEPICIVTLDVSAPGNKEGQNDGGNEEGQKNGGTNTGLIVGVLVSVLLALLAVVFYRAFLLYKKLRCSSQEQNQPPAAKAELQAMNAENNQETGQ